MTTTTGNITKSRKAKQTSKAAAPRGISQKELRDELEGFVTLCFAITEDLDMKELSNRAQLSVSTLYRLLNGNVSLSTHVGTIRKLGVAAGVRLVTSNYGTQVRLI